MIVSISRREEVIEHYINIRETAVVPTSRLGQPCLLLWYIAE